MRFKAVNILLAALLLTMLAAPAQAQDEIDDDLETQRLAQTGMKFLSVSISPRAAAMGNAITAEERRSASIFYNPAGAARMDQTVHVSLAQVDWIADHEYNAGAIAFRPGAGQYGVVGLSVRSVDYGEFLGTIRAENEQGYRNIGNYSPSGTAVGVSYSRVLTDRFSVGGNVKWVRESLGEHAMDVDEEGNLTMEETSLSAYAVDFGVIYQTGFQGLNFAVNLRNFAREQVYHQEDFELPLSFQIGLSMDMAHIAGLNTDYHTLRVGLGAERPRDYHEQVKLGGEYVFQDFLALRAGYTYPTDEQNLSLGGGINYEIADVLVGADYAYTAFGIFGQVHRVGVNFGF